MIDLETFRSRIGTYQFQNGRTKSQKLGNLLVNKLNKTVIMKKFSSLFLVLIPFIMVALTLIYSPIISTYSKTDENNRTLIKFSGTLNQDQDQEEVWIPGISWSFCLSTNKLCHIIYGNRRNIGYKYFGWNCDRGKIE